MVNAWRGHEKKRKICLLLLEIYKPFLCFRSLFEAEPIMAHKCSCTLTATIYNWEKCAYIRPNKFTVKCSKRIRRLGSLFQGHFPMQPTLWMETTNSVAGEWSPSPCSTMLPWFASFMFYLKVLHLDQILSSSEILCWGRHLVQLLTFRQHSRFDAKKMVT